MPPIQFRLISNYFLFCSSYFIHRKRFAWYVLNKASREQDLKFVKLTDDNLNSPNL